jgi:lysophospholipase L1-like esterase
MSRPFRVLVAGVALVLATVGLAAPASAASASASASAAPAPPPAPPLPGSMAAIGDSITRAVDVCCFYGSRPSHSWSTGYAPDDAITSHYERIRALNPAIRGHRYNYSMSGARMADAPGQARRAVARGAQYVTILMGANDLCRSDGTLTSTGSFRAQFAETLRILRTGLPNSRVFVASIPNLHQLWSVLRTRPLAQLVWQSADICPAMLDLFNSPADRNAVINRERSFNRILEEVCATWANCRFDGYLTYNYNFARGMVSRLDYLHPSLAGQATLASLTWKASWWGS